MAVSADAVRDLASEFPVLRREFAVNRPPNVPEAPAIG